MSSNHDQQRIVIVGGSAAGQSAAQALVEQGHRGPVTLVTAEARRPYKRTKVSKSFAKGFSPDAFALVDQSWYAEHGVELLVGQRATRLDLDGHRLELGQRPALAWDRLILATGAEARRLPLPDDLARLMHHAHDIVEVEALRSRALAGARTALVIGMGVLGVEVAEQLTRLGLRVTLAGEDRGPIASELNGPAAAMLGEVLAEHGVELITGVTIGSLTRGAGDALEADLGAGSREFDLVACCIGTRVRTSLASEAGLVVARGVVVDATLRTSHPDVLAAGDVAQLADGRVTHLWRHALHQGRVAGLNAAGAAEPYRLEPFRLKCKVFGQHFFALERPAAERLEQYEVVERRAGASYQCAYFAADGRVSGLVVCNDEPNMARYNQAIVERWSREQVEVIGSW